MYDPADELAVRSLAAAYTDAVNRRDADGMAAVFAPDGVIEKPGFGDYWRAVDLRQNLTYSLQDSGLNV